MRCAVYILFGYTVVHKKHIKHNHVYIFYWDILLVFKKHIKQNHLHVCFVNHMKQIKALHLMEG